MKQWIKVIRVSSVFLVILLGIGVVLSPAMTKKEKLEILEKRYSEGKISKEMYKEMKSELVVSVIEDKDNLVVSHSFEKDSNSDGLADNWKRSCAQSLIGLDKGVSHRGEWSLKVSPSKRSKRIENWYQTVKVQEGKKYDFILWCKSEDLSQEIYNYNGIQFLDAQGKKIGPSLTISTALAEGTKNWQKLRLVVVAPSQASQAEIILGTYKAKGTIWYDDISFEQVK